MPNQTFSASGSTGTKGSEDYKEFSVEYSGYSSDQDGLDLMVSEYGINRIVDIVNKDRATTAVNNKRRELTAHKTQEKTAKANAFDELLACTTEEEKLAVMKKYNLA